ncbi:translation initiation factor IF-2-like [Cricetulus griseus]|uniref:Translation initiation factor IF-2-like n=1 Tax=Cricetulus griseus TaxID=10029 RepID=A0A9J7GRB3_CRIGR|nr:translation initiation factor IF-2-like [Cricetulus griseus]
MTPLRGLERACWASDTCREGGSERRASAAIIGQLAPRLPRPPVRSRRAPPWCADTPPHAGPRPLRLAVVRVRHRAPPAGRASAGPARVRRGAPAPLAAPVPRRAERRPRGVRAAGRTTAARARGGGGWGRRSPSAAAGAGAWTLGKPRPLPRAGSARARPPAAHPVPCTRTERSLRPDARRIFRGWRVWAAGPRGGAAGEGRLHLLSGSPGLLAGGAAAQAVMRDD